MPSDLNINQFKQTAIKGMLTFGVNLNVVTARVAADSEPIFPGDAVTINGDSSTTTLIVERYTNGDGSAVAGYCRYDPKGAGNSSQSFGPGKLIEVAFDNCFMILEAGEAFIQGSQLAYNSLTGQMVETPVDAGDPYSALAYTASAAEGDLFVALIKGPDLVQNFPPDAISFLELSDTPNSFSGAGLQAVRVNAGATALEFFTNSFLLLSDTPDTYVAAATFTVKVNSGATALEFVNVV